MFRTGAPYGCIISFIRHYMKMTKWFIFWRFIQNTGLLWKHVKGDVPWDGVSPYITFWRTLPPSPRRWVVGFEVGWVQRLLWLNTPKLRLELLSWDMVTVRQTKSASCRVTGGSGNWPSSEDERRSFFLCYYSDALFPFGLTVTSDVRGRG